ncbi:AhpC/TSA family protein [Lishizhenia tianjinensis]|uniref:AhpC/TSA family protein n=1 Tax=Lishizhenia tianjinensis TaxID=477690 RepID=A0A1I6YUV0_9FLAO|nr:thioredoxin family protein [Lishizhenia tianjinensis]SFT54295.1 AhpC/TSA family protein [Lishizhenia tianjinensis]
MALTASNDMAKGTLAPDFHHIDTISEEMFSFSDVKGEKGTVVMFICNHCPYVILINDKLVEIANHYQKQGIGFVAISSNDVERYPQDSPGMMKIHAEELEYSFPYLYDDTQATAKAYDAACTPDIFVFDKEDKLYFHGQIDDARPGNGIEVTGGDLTHALDLLVKNEKFSGKEMPCMGCGIKWK